jgi:hypothetical protein
LLKVEERSAGFVRREERVDVLQAREGTLETLNVEDVGVRDVNIVHVDRTGCWTDATSQFWVEDGEKGTTH